MEANLLERFSLHLNNPSDAHAGIRALSSAKALLANPNSSDSTRRAIVDGLTRLLCRGNADLTYLRYIVKLLGDVAALNGLFAPSIMEVLRPLLEGEEKLVADALSALASVDGFLLEEGLVLSLASSPHVSVRSMLVKLLVSSLDRDKRSIVVMKPHCMIRVLLGLAEDLYPRIRAKVVDGLALICRINDSVVGFQTVKCFNDRATSLLHNDGELTRLSAIRLISACGQFLANNKGDARFCELTDAIFAQELLYMALRMSSMRYGWLHANHLGPSAFFPSSFQLLH